MRFHFVKITSPIYLIESGNLNGNLKVEYKILQGDPYASDTFAAFREQSV